MDARFLLIGLLGDAPLGEAGASARLAEAAARDPLAGILIRAAAIPSDPEASLLKALEMLDLHLPDALLLVAHGPAGPVTVERAGLNIWPGREASGPPGEAHAPLDAGGPAELACTIPVERIVRRLGAEGIVAESRPFPASYLVNRIAYGLLRYCTLRGDESWFRALPPAGLSARIGTMHLPWPPEPAAARTVRLAVEETRCWMQHGG